MTQKKFEVDNYYQDLPELGNRALNLLSSCSSILIFVRRTI